MSEEEMKAIDLLKNIDKQKCIMLECPVVKNNIERQLKIIELNRIIRKQSKEIEELKKYEKYYEEMEEVNKKFLPVDKIKAKIEELKQKKYILSSRESEIEILQSLLEKED